MERLPTTYAEIMESASHHDRSHDIDLAQQAIIDVRPQRSPEMTVHHIGIVTPDTKLFTAFGFLVGSNDSAPSEICFRHVPEFQCDCYLLGKIELVVPNGPHMEGTPLDRWLRSRGRSLHHIAFEVSDLDTECDRLRAAGVPVVLEAAVDGVAGLRVNFVHPSYCGFLIELVEAP
jgi:catechol 2,3-dioxygenase-like lactoylglutathione lyase family enzyme